MKQPNTDKNGCLKFESIKVQVPYGKKCMVCGELLKTGNAISAHDPNRNGEILLPRQTNFLPPRYGIMIPVVELLAYSQEIIFIKFLNSAGYSLSD